jgi:hypothetical protein
MKSRSKKDGCDVEPTAKDGAGTEEKAELQQLSPTMDEKDQREKQTIHDRLT